MKKLLFLALAVCLALAACAGHSTTLKKDYVYADGGSESLYYIQRGDIDRGIGWVQIPDVLFDTFAGIEFPTENYVNEATKPTAEQIAGATIADKETEDTPWLSRGKNRGYTFWLLGSIDVLPYAGEGAWKVQVMESPGLDAKWLRVVNYVPPGK